MRDPNQLIERDSISGRVRVRTINLDPSLTQQQFVEECDINNIMKKYEKTGEFLHLTSKTGVYADFSEISDYQTMLQTVQDAQVAFNALPAKMRQRFGEDPGKLIAFLQDTKNYDEAIELGLIDKKIQTETKTEIKTETKTETK